MPRLIDADALLDFLAIMPIDADDIFYSGLLNSLEKLAFKSMIDKMPTVDPVRHGHWERHFSRPNVYADMFWHCSECGYKNENQWANKYHNYCPCCGAKMDE